MTGDRQPGDFAVCPIRGTGGALIGLGERMCGSGFSQWRHAKIYVGDGLILQAEPAGAVIVREDVRDGDWWSTGLLELTGEQRQRVAASAHRWQGTPYSWADYAAIGLHHWHVPAPGLRAYIASTGHMICSQLVDQVLSDAGVRLFDDGRWPGYVMPADLAAILAAARRGAPR